MFIIRFAIYFIIFGLIFYGIHLYFPEMFATLQSWAGATYNFLGDVWTWLASYIHNAIPAGTPKPSGS